MTSFRFCRFNDADCGLVLDRGYWAGYVGSPKLPLVGRHRTAAAALAALEDHLREIDEALDNDVLRQPRSGYRQHSFP